MKIYTVLLQKQGFFNVPDVSGGTEKVLPMVLDGLEAAEYVIVDVQPATEDGERLLQKSLTKYPNRCLLQFTLPLPAHSIGNNPAMYRYCVEALSSGFLCLENEEQAVKQPTHDCLLKFKVEEKYADLVFEDYDVVRGILKSHG